MTIDEIINEVKLQATSRYIEDVSKRNPYIVVSWMDYFYVDSMVNSYFKNTNDIKQQHIEHYVSDIVFELSETGLSHH